MYRSPLCWVGGKFFLASQLIKMFPEHTTYVEVFGGAGHILFRKEASKSEIYNDIDSGLVNFFDVVRGEQYSQLAEMLNNTLYAREIFDRCKKEMDNKELSNLQRAFCFIVVNKQCFGGKMEAWGVHIAGSKVSERFMKLSDVVKQAHERLKTVQIENSDFAYILNNYDRPKTFFYCDPPYVFSGERGSTKVYKHEMTDEQHSKLVDILLGVQGKVMLSGYENDIYKRLEAKGWDKIHVRDSNMCVKRCVDEEKRTKKADYVWVNYDIK